MNLSLKLLLQRLVAAQIAITIAEWCHWRRRQRLHCRAAGANI